VKPRARRKAVTLVLTLWMVVVLGVIASSLAFDVQVNSKLAMLQRNQFLAYSLAKSAVAVGMTHLQNDLLIDHQENPGQEYDALSDVWAQPDRREKDIEVELGNGTYEVEVTDEDGKINLNTANPKLLKAMVEYYGFEAPDSDEIANAIYDWRDPDDMTVGAAGERENEHYSGLMGQKIRMDTTAEDLIYQCRNEPYLTTEELLDVFGITPELFYGYDPDSEDAKENKRRNDIALGKYVHETKKRKSEKQLALKDIVTVRSSGRINVNTASEEVLTILMYAGTNCTNMEAATAAAESIGSFRGTGRKGKTPDPEDAFRSIADLAKIPGINQQMIGALNNSGSFGVQVGFRSNNFTITGIGRYKNARKTIQAVIERSLDTYNPDDVRLLGKSGSSGRKLSGSFAARGGMRRKGQKEEDNFIRIPAIRVRQWIE
jgi:type II secretory pathway component PulK